MLTRVISLSAETVLGKAMQALRQVASENAPSAKGKA